MALQVICRISTLHMYVCVYVCMCVCMYVYIHIYIYIYIYTGFFKVQLTRAVQHFMGKHVFTFIRRITAHVYAKQYLFIYFSISHGHGGFSHGYLP